MEQIPRINHINPDTQRSPDSLRVQIRIDVASQHNDFVMALALVDEKGMSDIVDEAIEYYVNNRPQIAIYSNDEVTRVLGSNTYYNVKVIASVRHEMFSFLFDEIARLNLLTFSDIFDIILYQYLEKRVNDPMLPALVEESRHKQQKRFNPSKE